MNNNSQLKVIVALIIMLTISMMTSFKLLKEWETSSKAVHAVDSYINKTMDTGQMDDFLESPEGKTFVEYTYK